MTGHTVLNGLNSNKELVSSTVLLSLLPSTASHSSFLWTTPPTARQTRGGHTRRETGTAKKDRKDRQGKETRKGQKAGREGQKRSRQNKETGDETRGSVDLSDRHTGTYSMFVDTWKDTGFLLKT